MSDEEDTGQMSSQLDEQMLQYIEKDAEQGRTAQATSWAWNRFSVWLSKREIDEDPVMMSTESLAAVLYRFMESCDVRKPMQHWTQAA